VKAFANARTVDGTAGSLRFGTSTIVVDDNGRIDRVTTGEVPLPETWDVVDCGGRIVHPGLIDMHTHLNEASLGLFVNHGVTTVRDVGNDLGTVLRLRASTSEGAQRGPRVHCAGPILDGDPPLWPDTSYPVQDEPSIAAAVNYLAEAGVDGIKLYMGITAPMLAAAVDAAHQSGLPVTAHLGATTCLEAAAAGVGTLEHAPQALYSSLVPPERVLKWDQRGTMGQSRFWAQFLRGWTQVDPSSVRTDDVLGTLQERRVVLDPTLVVFQRMVQWATDPDSLRGLAATVDPTISEGWVSSAEWFVGDWSSDDLQAARDALEVIKSVVVRFAELGGTLVVGTDVPFDFLVPGASLHDELEILWRAGLPAEKLLKAATADAAHCLGWASDVGAIEPGRFADLVVFSGNPFEDITDVRKVAAVYKGGISVFAAE
jgi:cytosine/adenosine deaminase-related metal-dependent hydrolase